MPSLHALKSDIFTGPISPIGPKTDPMVGAILKSLGGCSVQG